MGQWLQTIQSKHKKCPFKCSFKEKKAHPVVKDMLSDLQVRCCYVINGCKEILTYDALEKHQNECEFNALPCKECKKPTLKKELSPHEENCPDKIIMCHKCETSMKRIKMRAHTEVACLQSQVMILTNRTKMLMSKVKALETWKAQKEGKIVFEIEKEEEKEKEFGEYEFRY